MKFRSALILGSTSEIAENICLELACRGCKRFHLISRNPDKNNSLIAKLNNLQITEITTETLDLNNSFNLKEVYDQYDFYLIAVGFLGDIKKTNKDFIEAKEIFEINFLNLVPWIMNITNENRVKKPGALWILSSVAGDLGRPSNYFYGSSKSALTTFCEGLSNCLYGYPFKVRIIKAGFIRTRMTKGKAPEILCANPRSLSIKLLNSSNKSGVEYQPKWWFFVMYIIKKLPKSFISKL